SDRDPRRPARAGAPPRRGAPVAPRSWLAPPGVEDGVEVIQAEQPQLEAAPVRGEGAQLLLRALRLVQLRRELPPQLSEPLRALGQRLAQPFAGRRGDHLVQGSGDRGEEQREERLCRIELPGLPSPGLLDRGLELAGERGELAQGRVAVAPDCGKALLSLR